MARSKANLADSLLLGLTFSCRSVRDPANGKSGYPYLAKSARKKRTPPWDLLNRLRDASSALTLAVPWKRVRPAEGCKGQRDRRAQAEHFMPPADGKKEDVPWPQLDLEHPDSV